jgi:hypothetical protein
MVQVGLAEVQLVSIPAGILAVSDEMVLLRGDPEYQASSVEATDQQPGMPTLAPHASPVTVIGTDGRTVTRSTAVSIHISCGAQVRLALSM